MDSEMLRNNVSITTGYSQDGIDVTKISATFQFNGTYLNCVSSEKWAQNLPIVTLSNGSIRQPCLTSNGLFATFILNNFKVEDDGSFSM